MTPFDPKKYVTQKPWDAKDEPETEKRVEIGSFVDEVTSTDDTDKFDDPVPTTMKDKVKNLLVGLRITFRW